MRKCGIRSGEAGQSLVEFAVASVIFLLTIFGIVGFGLAVWQYNMVADLAQEGARWASVHGSTSTSPQTAANVLTYVQIRAGGLNVTNCTARSTSNPGLLGPGAPVTVCVQLQSSAVTVFLPSTTLTSMATWTMSR